MFNDRFLNQEDCWQYKLFSFMASKKEGVKKAIWKSTAVKLVQV